MAWLGAFELWTFITILLLTFSLFLVITGAFTAYFGSGKSRKIGSGLLVGGLVVGVLWALGVGPYTFISNTIDLSGVLTEAIGVILAGAIGAAVAIGLFLLALMQR